MKKTRLVDIIRKVVNEQLELESQASDAAKQQGLEYMSFGRWGKNGKVTHTTQGGKLVPIKTMDPRAAGKAKAGQPTFGDRSPEGQRRRNRPEPEKDATRGARGNTGTDAGNRIVNKVLSKFWSGGADTAADDALVGKYGYYKDIPADEFTSITGIPKKAAVWVAQNNNDYEQPFSYDAETDTFQVHDPYDV
jgi:hypothetical protein